MRRVVVTCYLYSNVMTKRGFRNPIATLPSVGLGNLHYLAVPKFPHMKHRECQYYLLNGVDLRIK